MCLVSVEDDPPAPRDHQQHQPGSDLVGRPQLHEGVSQRETEADEERLPTQNPQDPITHALQAQRSQGIV